MATFKFMLTLALACGLLAMLALPLGDALVAFFWQGFGLSLLAAAGLALADGLRTAIRAWRFLLTGREG